MSRVKRGLAHTKKRQSLKKRVKGFEGGRKKLIKLAKTAEIKAGSYAYRDRRVRKRTMRQLWQVRINAAVREYGLSYSAFMGLLKKKGINLDRKILAQMAAQKPALFQKLLETVK